MEGCTYQERTWALQEHTLLALFSLPLTIVLLSLPPQLAQTAVLVLSFMVAVQGSALILKLEQQSTKYVYKIACFCNT